MWYVRAKMCGAKIERLERIRLTISKGYDMRENIQAARLKRLTRREVCAMAKY